MALHDESLIGKHTGFVSVKKNLMSKFYFSNDFREKFKLQNFAHFEYFSVLVLLISKNLVLESILKATPIFLTNLKKKKTE